MGERPHTEELRDMVEVFKKEAEWLYRYENLITSYNFFKALSINDQKRLIYWVLKEGDEDARKVAHYLIKNFRLPWNTLEELLMQMEPQDKAEIEAILAQSVRDEHVFFPSDTDQGRIQDVLLQAQNRIGYLMVEEAYWVLIPYNTTEGPIWITAIDEPARFKSHSHSPGQVFYHPNETEKYKLLTAMHSASWILHIHNHPKLFSGSDSLRPSLSDLEFSGYWKSVRSKLGKKMKFFIVHEDSVIEYSKHRPLEQLPDEYLPSDSSKQPEPPIFFAHELTEEQHQEVRKIKERIRKKYRRGETKQKEPNLWTPLISIGIFIILLALLLLFMFIASLLD